MAGASIALGFATVSNDSSIRVEIRRISSNHRPPVEISVHSPKLDVTLTRIDFEYFDAQDKPVKLTDEDPCRFAKPNEDCFSENFVLRYTSHERNQIHVAAGKTTLLALAGRPAIYAFAPGFLVKKVRVKVEFQGEKNPIFSAMISIR